ncbi:preprotein translocase subunit YajC [Desulfovermiculus halophilus]|uniref:preprotein translocase subunit YajC n=1 Tax=Desulfovermiculus halophilus TaxID=339722 RepID=UPI0004893FCA|nr:preprotein translocase subunit YajC [Desulfovermiculus halophilus]
MLWQDVAYAMGQSAGGAGGQNPLVAFMPLIILFVIFYFLLIRPQQKKAKEHKEMLNNLKRGDSVITGGGLYGRINAINEDVLTLDLGGGQEVKVNRGYIATVTDKKVVESGKKEKKAKTEAKAEDKSKAEDTTTTDE